MNIFRRQQVAFAPVDPLGDGLREAIEAERREPEAIRLDEDPAAEYISQAWQEIVHQAAEDPEWFSFVRDE